MNSKSTAWVYAIIGSFIGSYIPALWGDGVFSLWAIILSAVGAVIGIWIGFNIDNQ
jgi:uncharacterized membrane protein YeaQ/YmgE (transglycosylase-associated protein family)